MCIREKLTVVRVSPSALCLSLPFHFERKLCLRGMASKGAGKGVWKNLGRRGKIHFCKNSEKTVCSIIWAGLADSLFYGTSGVLFKKGKEGERMSGLKPTAVRKQCGKEPKTALKLVQKT